MNIDVEKAIRSYLPGIVHLSLATSRDNKPWVCEVHFAYDDNLNLYFRSLPSRRHSQDIADNPQVAGNIVTQHDVGQKPAGVYFEGTTERLEGEEQAKAFGCLKARLDLGDDKLEEAKRQDGAQFYKISVENYYVFGSFEGQPVGKHQLRWN
jgi:uncharacterized protein YhbP (UPF0306 family)